MADDKRTDSRIVAEDEEDDPREEWIRRAAQSAHWMTVLERAARW